jgi:hypothetical protein
MEQRHAAGSLGGLRDIIQLPMAPSWNAARDGGNTRHSRLRVGERTLCRAASRLRPQYACSTLPRRFESPPITNHTRVAPSENCQLVW